KRWLALLQGVGRVVDMSDSEHSHTDHGLTDGGMVERMRQAAVSEILNGGWIQTCRWVEEIDSTNAAMGRAVQSPNPPSLPALLVADRQTSGRGRGDHRWYSPSGCLMCTLAVDGDMLPGDPRQLTQMALVVGVAVAETAERFVPPSIVSLKWPNDLYVKDRKCGGILIESVSGTRQRLQHFNLVGNASRPPASSTGARSNTTWMIGIGINASVDWENAPRGLEDTATSLSAHTPRPVEVADVLIELTARLARRLDAWSKSDSDWLPQWQQRCLLSGRTITARSFAGESISGKCEGIDNMGRLLIRTVRGVQPVQSAEILHWS
ncbi:MAG: biotin--[acetyl-CoA-carboxylase] ligase, partial [Planctomycetota bacterium]